MDDCLTALPRDKIEEFQEHINSVNPNIQFTSEKEADRKIPFLDMIIKRDFVGNLSFGVYRKPTNSGRYLDYDSYHHTRHKRSVVSSL